MKEDLGWSLSILGVDRDPHEFHLMFLSQKIDIKQCQRNWVVAAISDFLIPKSLQHNVVYLRYFKQCQRYWVFVTNYDILISISVLYQVLYKFNSLIPSSIIRFRFLKYLNLQFLHNKAQLFSFDVCLQDYH